MLFVDGYRPNVCVAICNTHNEVLLFRRVQNEGWQFPQGGLSDNETPEEAMFRELYEEVGLQAHDVKILAKTHAWLRYNVPNRWMRASSRGVMHGQKQQWFLLQLLSSTNAINFSTTDHPEFNDWRWVKYWEPIHEVVDFKKSVYQRALLELAPYLPNGPERLHHFFSDKCSHKEDTMANPNAL